jgi:hypothetical protein
MSRLHTLITITDGCDTCDDDGCDFELAIRRLREKRLFSLSCGIGQTDVDHEGLTLLAAETGGLHIAVRGSEGVAQALSDLTQFIRVRVASVTAEVSTDGGDAMNHVSIASAAPVRVAVDAFLLIDCSWSMFGMRDEDDWSGDKEKIVRTRQSACALVDSLNPRFDQVGVARFWRNHEILCRPTDDFTQCKRCIEGIAGGPGTGLYRAIAAIAGIFEDDSGS